VQRFDASDAARGAAGASRRRPIPAPCRKSICQGSLGRAARVPSAGRCAQMQQLTKSIRFVQTTLKHFRKRSWTTGALLGKRGLRPRFDASACIGTPPSWQHVPHSPVAFVRTVAPRAQAPGPFAA
jgi:hypothetical protein